ncbi:MAG TPA: hypothetical protein ENK23_01170 [Sorangium sp.]|nr:hypothetical protein [Sorangium sp.]
MNPRQPADFDIQLAPWLRHWGPVFLCWFCLLLSLSGRSVFVRFKEGQLGTWLGVLLMVSVAVVCVAAARTPEINPRVRLAAWVLGGVSALAAVEDTVGVHEEIGYWVQDNVDWLPDKLAHWTDDILIIIGAAAGGGLLLWCVWRTGRVRRNLAYIAAAVAVAFAHGALDLMSHGIAFLKMVFPHLPKTVLRSFEDRMSFGEECCKIWAAWFVLLFVQRFLHRDKVELLWSWTLFLALPLAALSVWQVGDPTAGVPYLMLGAPLGFVRNYHVFAELSLMWMAWATASWVLLRDRPTQRAWFGLLFVGSAAALSGGHWSAEGYGQLLANVADGLLPNAYWAADPFAYSLYLLLLLGPGLLLGWVMVLAVRAGVRGVGVAVFIAGAAAVWGGAAAAFAATGFALGVLVLLLLLNTAPITAARARVGGLVAAVALAATALLPRLGPLLPNYRFKDRKHVFFRVHYQPLVRRGRR